MKLWGVFRFELAYQGRRGWPWLFFAALLALTFLFVRVNYVADALYDDLYVNAPFLIAGATVFGGLIWLLAAAAIAGEAGARDVATGMYPLIYTAPISKTEYLGGRFLAALALNAVLLLAVQAGIMLAVYWPGIGTKVTGPFRPAAYLTAYAVIALPNAVVATALQFSLAVRSGRAMASYLGSVLLIFMGFFVASLLLFRRGLGTLLDPIGIRFIVEDLAHAWTTIEKNQRLVTLEGAVLENRLLWVGIAVATLLVTALRFRFAHRIESSWWMLRRRSREAEAPTPARLGVTTSKPISVPHAPRARGLAFHARQTIALTWTSFRAIAASWAGLGTLIAIPLVTVLVLIDQMSSMGTPLVPTTARVLSELTAPLSAELSRWVIIPLLIVFFAGELVWRERDAGLGELSDAMPGSEWPPFLGKLLGLGLLLFTLTGLMMLAGIVAQTVLGYTHLEIMLYLEVLFGLQLPEYLLFAALALAAHVVVDQKYVGHLTAILAYVFIVALAGMLGIEHNLLVYGASPAWSYTEMRGFGASLAPWIWFKLYWAAWAILLGVVARLLWVRGTEHSIRVRLAVARHRVTRSTASVAGAAAVLVVSLGAFLFYNTNVLNAYVSTAEGRERRAEYERRYRRYEKIPQPRLAGTTLRVEIHPERRVVDVRGSYRLVNGADRTIDSIHIATATGGVETRAMTFDRPATLVVDDATHGYRIYALQPPLEPGDTLRLDFDVHVERRGFGNRGVDPSVAAKGSSFTNAAWFPFIGYQRYRELISASDRRAHGLEPRPVVASLYDTEGREPASRGGGIAFDAVVGTDADQMAVAPGALRRTWTERGRRYFHYVTDAPIGSEWSFFSAPYAVDEGRWNDVAIRIFHDPRHTAHVDRVMRSVRASLDYYSRQFGPYPYHHLTIVEQPGAPGTGLHADASIISHGEAFSLWAPTDTQRLDLPSAVVAHEMAHQWTLPYALVEGLPFLSEGLAWYSAMQVVRESRGDAELRRLLAFMREPYPFRPIRRGEPLLRALDPYLAYRRGPFAMYAVSQYVGADRVNGALRHLIQTHDSAGAPLATTLDLYRGLQAVTPDSLRYLLHDLFEVNTYWQLETTRVEAKQVADTLWQVTLDVRARKMVYDSAGVETEVRMDEWFPVGVFGAAEGSADELSAPLHAQMHRIRSGEQTITVTVSRKPVLAGLDPYHLLDWEVRDGDDDNIERVTITR